MVGPNPSPRRSRFSLVRLSLVEPRLLWPCGARCRCCCFSFGHLLAAPGLAAGRRPTCFPEGAFARVSHGVHVGPCGLGPRASHGHVGPPALGFALCCSGSRRVASRPVLLVTPAPLFFPCGLLATAAYGRLHSPCRTSCPPPAAAAAPLPSPVAFQSRLPMCTLFPAGLPAPFLHHPRRASFRTAFLSVAPYYHRLPWWGLAPVAACT